MDLREALLERPWDHASGLRERLALLAAIGPTLEPSAWRYDSVNDAWYYRGGTREARGNDYVTIPQKGSVSLTLIANKWNVNWAAAMIIVGYPDMPDEAHGRGSKGACAIRC